MKIQFASIEALAALLLISSIAGIGINMLNQAYHEAIVGRMFGLENMAAFDFINEVYTNSSFESCINQTASNSSCIINYLSLYKETYHLNGILLSANKTYKIGNITEESLRRCFPYDDRVLCIYLG